MTELLRQAFKALNSGSTPREFALVAEALVASGDEETLRTLDEAARLGEPFDALVDDVVELGGSHFEVLDLVSAVSMRRAAA